MHALFALLFARGLTLSEKCNAVGFIQSIKRENYQLAQDTTVAALLMAHNQSNAVCRWLWEPLCVSALNTPAGIASAQVFLNVLRDSLGGMREASDLIFPRVDLSALFPEPASDYVLDRGGMVHLGITIGAVICDSDARYQLQGDPTSKYYDQVIVATSPHRTADLLRHLPELVGSVNAFDALDYQPIYTCYLKYPETVTLNTAMRGLPGPCGQWVFDRGYISGESLQQGLLAVVVSAEGHHQAEDQTEIALSLHHELARVLPGLVQPLWSKVIAEKRATFACRPNIQRPSIATPLPGLYIANDAVASEYPATLEGAVRAGISVAALL